ncbi:MAG: DUF1186 domain-containing protein [Chloroflexi bacterium]|nr:DUF1186 domain-containing protein [Chloroflexota bacterium]
MPDERDRIEAASRLVGTLYTCGEWVLPAVIEGIIASGELAIESLEELIRSDIEGKGVTYSGLIFAVRLLGRLGSEGSVPVLIDLLRHYDEYILDDIARALGTLRPSAVEPSLALVADRELSWYQRGAAIEAAMEAARGDVALVERVRTALKAELEALISRSAEVTEDEEAVGAQIVSALADLGNLEDWPLVEAAYDAGVVEDEYIDRETSEGVFSNGLEPIRPMPLVEYFDTYPKQYAAYVAQIDTLLRIAKNIPIPGRNDPCWCGSGKKYKQCHWADDQVASRPLWQA